MLLGPRHWPLLPVIALVGAIFLIWVDTVARTVFEPREVPVGIITALIGVPVFMVLLGRREVRGSPSRDSATATAIWPSATCAGPSTPGASWTPSPPAPGAAG